MSLKRISLFTFLILLLFCNPSLSWDEYGNWSNDQPDHRFGTLDAPVLGDEGYRWRKDFNIRIFDDMAELNIADWCFDPVIVWNNSRTNFDDGEVYNNFSGGFDGIHNHLSKISWNALNGEGNFNDPRKHFACAAITMVVQEKKGFLKAYSKVITDEGRVLCLCANGRRGFKNEVGNHFAIVDQIGSPSESNPKLSLRMLNEALNVNINENGTYGDCEGRIVRAMLDYNGQLLKSNVASLMRKARLRDGRSIKLIIFHIHTIKDPCAVCTRVLVGLSKKMNDKQGVVNIDSILQDLLPMTYVNSKFLVQVSSNEHYSCGKNCSHAECSGIDGGINMVPEVNVGHTIIPKTSKLAIPFGIRKIDDPSRPNLINLDNFVFSRSFPPYVIFSRVAIPGKDIVQLQNTHPADEINHAPHDNPKPRLSLIK